MMVEPIVEISDGKLKGTIRKNYKGEDFYAFLGIPFAKPPVGELRFKVSDHNIHLVLCMLYRNIHTYALTLI